MNKNTSILLITAVAGIMIAGALAVTMTTSSVYAIKSKVGGENGVNGNGGGSDNAHCGNPNANCGAGNGGLRVKPVEGW